MAFLKLYRKKVRGELYFLNNIFESRNIKWVLLPFAEMKYT
jgi:hypothetical protein